MAQTKAQLVVGLNVNASAPASALQIDASGNVNLDSNTLFVDATNNRVGIGTSSPATILNTFGTSSQEIRMSTNTAGDARLGFDLQGAFYNWIESYRASGRMSFATGNTVAMSIDSSQRVGIGTTSPARGPLHVHATSLESHLHLTNADTGSTGNDGFSLVAMTSVDNREAWLIQRENAAMRFFTNSSEKAAIDSSGRLLVGTSSASGGTNARALIAGNTNSAPGVIQIASTSASPASGDALGVLRFSDSGHTQASAINCERDGGTWTSGSSQPTRLVFSTTYDTSSSPTARVAIRETGTTWMWANECLILQNPQAAGTTHPLISGTYSASSLLTAGTVSFRVWNNGNVQNTNNSYTAISDLKLKENIVDAGSQWSDIKALQVRNYNLKEGQTHRQIGLIAQEVEPISPGLVYETPDRDAEGNDLGTVTKSVNYSVLYMKAVKALQEAMERIEVLEQRLTDAGIA